MATTISRRRLIFVSSFVSRAMSPPPPRAYFGLMPFRNYCIDILSRGSDLQFDSRPMEIYDAVNLIDSALTFVAGSFVCARANVGY